MGRRKICSSRSSYLFTILVLLIISLSHGLNLGLIAGDLKRLASPLVIKKISKHTPVFININSGLPKSKFPLSLPKLPLKPPPLHYFEESPTKKVPRSLPPPILPPLLHFTPILPPIFPPLVPILPLLPILPPLLPKLRIPLKPLRVPILKRSTLKLPKSELKIPLVKTDKKYDIKKKLLDLKKKGSLTTAEYFRFKKLLLK